MTGLSSGVATSTETRDTVCTEVRPVILEGGHYECLTERFSSFACK